MILQRCPQILNEPAFWLYIVEWKPFPGLTLLTESCPEELLGQPDFVYKVCCVQPEAMAHIEDINPTLAVDEEFLRRVFTEKASGLFQLPWHLQAKFPDLVKSTLSAQIAAVFSDSDSDVQDSRTSSSTSDVDEDTTVRLGVEQCINENFWQDDEFVRIAMRLGADIFQFANEKWRKDPQLVLWVLETSPDQAFYFPRVDKALRGDKEFMKLAIRTAPSTFVRAFQFRKDEELFLLFASLAPKLEVRIFLRCHSSDFTPSKFVKRCSLLDAFEETVEKEILQPASEGCALAVLGQQGGKEVTSILRTFLGLPNDKEQASILRAACNNFPDDY